MRQILLYIALAMFVSELSLAKTTDLKKIENLVLKNSPNWQKAMAEWKSIEIDQRSFLTNFLPQASLRYSVSTSWLGDERDGATSALARVSQPLLDPYSIYTRLKVLNSQESLNDVQKRQKKLLVIYAARRAYFDLLFWKKSYDTALQLYQQSKNDFLDIESRYKKGLASREDLIRFQLSYENFRQQQETRKQRLWRAENLLSILTGQKIVSEQLSFSLSPKYFAVSRSALKKSLTQAKSIDVLVQKGRYDLAKSKYRDSYTNHIPTFSAFFQQALEEVQYDYNGALLGFSLDWKIFSGLRDYNDNRSSYYKMLVSQSELSISKQSYDIKVAEWTSSLMANKEKVIISKSRLGLVDELVRSGVSRFTRGLISSDQVSKDKEMYSLTADQLLLAERDLYNTVCDIDASTGKNVLSLLLM